MVVVRPLAAVLVLLCSIALPSQALFEELTFTVVVDDPADNAGFLDILTIALAETGNQELVIRYEYDDTVPPAGPVSQDLFFTVDGTVYSTGINADGSAGGNGNFPVPAAKSCTMEGGFAYCVLGYDSFEGAVGSVLTGNYAISYAGSAQDYGPAMGGYVPQGLLGAVGPDYTLTGCTRTDAVCPIAAGTGPLYANLTSPALALNLTNATSGTHVYNFTNAASPVQLAYNVTGNGSVAIRVLDGNGTEAFNQTFANATSGQADLKAVTAGNWSYELTFGNFTGSVALDLVAPAAPAAANATANSTSSSPTVSPASGETTSADESIPGPGLLVALGALAIALRRRR